MFPTGLPGVALLLLRASVGIAVLSVAYAHGQQLSPWIKVAASVVSMALFLGYLTPVAAVAGLAFAALGWAGLGLSSLLIQSLDAIALAFLGPGAYSVDAYRFGRRVVVLPPD